MYLTLFDYDRSLRENVKSKVLSPTAVLYNEPEFLLRSKLPHPTPSVLRTSVLEGGATERAELSRGLERLCLSVALMWTPGDQSPAIGW